MGLSAPKNTLAYHRSRPFLLKRDMRGASLLAVAQQVEAFMASDKTSSVPPEQVAIEMYLLNHAFAKVQQTRAPYEPLPPAEDALVDLYFRKASVSAVRGFYYLLLICLRESRHLKNKGQVQQTLLPKHGADAVTLIGCMSDNSHAAGSTFANAVSGKAKTCKIGPFVEALRDQFYQGSYNGGYGGKAWGQVNDCLVNFVNGDYSAEMMMDTIWTLCHNNGPIFNKGMLFGNYSSGGSSLIRILDLQRAGQVPEGVLYDAAIKAWVTSSTRETALKIKDLWGCGDYVDWFVVEALGSQQKYTSEKQVQVSQHGQPAHLEAAAAAAKQAEQAKKAAEAAQFFEIMPGLKVKKIHLKRAA